MKIFLKQIFLKFCTDLAFLSLLMRKHCLSRMSMNLLQLATIIHQVISQAELASCAQRNHVYLCDRHQVLENYSADTCLGALYLRSDTGMQKHCRFERKAAKELVYQIFDLEHLIYSTIPNSVLQKWEEESAAFYHINQATVVHITFIDTACLHIHFIA